MFESSNHRRFQKGLDTEKLRSNRQKGTLSLRRKQREEHLRKRFRQIKSSSSSSSTAGEVENTRFCNMDEIQISEKEENIYKYVGMIMDMNSSIQSKLIAITALRKLLSRLRHPPTDKVLKSGGVPKIISFMSLPNRTGTNQQKAEINRLKFESAWIITNIAASTSECTHRVCQFGAIEGFVDLLRTGSHDDLSEQAIWGLGNISGDNINLRDRVLKSGIVADIIRYIPTWNGSLQENAIWTLSCLCRHQRGSNHLFLSYAPGIIRLFANLIREIKNIAIIPDCLWSLVFISNIDDDERISQSFTQNNIIRCVIGILQKETAKFDVEYQILSSQPSSNRNNINNNNINGPSQPLPCNIYRKALVAMNGRITQPCIRLIGNIVTGTDEQTQQVLDAGFLDIIQPFANHFVATIRRETMWILSNILAGTHSQIEYVITRPKLLSCIIKAINGESFPVKKEAAWCICNATADATMSQKKVLIEAGSIEALCQLLNNTQICRKDDSVVMILEGLESFLKIRENSPYNPYAVQIEECGGLDYMENISANQEIGEELFDQIQAIIDRYWGRDAIEVDDMKNQYVIQDKLNPNIDTNTNQFTFGCNIDDQQNINNNKQNENYNTQNFMANNNHNNNNSNNIYQF